MNEQELAVFRVRGVVFKLLAFELFDQEGREMINVNPEEVAAVREYYDRRAYGGQQPVSEIVLRSGAKWVICGHVAKQLGAE